MQVTTQLLHEKTAFAVWDARFRKLANHSKFKLNLDFVSRAQKTDAVLDQLSTT
jgi:hypothetical protein